MKSNESDNRYLENKRVLVTGGTGLIGIPLSLQLVDKGARVRVVSLDKRPSVLNGVEFIKGDICDRAFCDRILEDIDVVFHLAGIKGGIGVASSKAATFLIKNILMNIQIMEASREAGIERFLYASSICIYPPAEVFREENAFTGLPHPSDRFGGVAKMVGEMQIEAYKLQYGIENFMTVRPTNTYGPYDNFNPVSGLIIPALIYRVFQGENPLRIWGDGTAIRDFVYADDVGELMINVVERNEITPINAGSGEAVSIKSVAQTIVKHAGKFLKKPVEIQWDKEKPTGEKYRVASIEKVKSILGWSPKIDFDEGIAKTVEWYSKNINNKLERYSILSEE